mmetsp:Transcript_2111/g.4849  ORF Transcript_2111/g.4849 Transcript_2111/m.4849 type:complete len:83 (+) Transcript_2111:324-572(+)|eukprot:CAMPEP_0171497502 /NCGR_PEP_ID=MMETSP0958-20121227/7312_1 /TAXON_ID=87120 /ORGANISM="Aurantiochytrium limacinum, Strain ATCCMYA-1381" /LENGTH=82 /DNA_ID=CAMNT_0012031761 /DNA_START=248 /DNA_END=496 /DNA_ORIENTATION=+
MAIDEGVDKAGMVVLIVVIFAVSICGIFHGIYYRLYLSHEYLELEEAEKFNAERHAGFELVSRDGERVVMDRRLSSSSLDVV